MSTMGLAAIACASIAIVYAPDIDPAVRLAHDFCRLLNVFKEVKSVRKGPYLPHTSYIAEYWNSGDRRNADLLYRHCDHYLTVLKMGDDIPHLLQRLANVVINEEHSEEIKTVLRGTFNRPSFDRDPPVNMETFFRTTMVHRVEAMKRTIDDWKNRMISFAPVQDGSAQTPPMPQFCFVFMHNEERYQHDLARRYQGEMEHLRHVLEECQAGRAYRGVPDGSELNMKFDGPVQMVQEFCLYQNYFMNEEKPEYVKKLPNGPHQMSKDKVNSGLLMDHCRAYSTVMRMMIGIDELYSQFELTEISKESGEEIKRILNSAECQHSQYDVSKKPYLLYYIVDQFGKLKDAAEAWLTEMSQIERSVKSTVPHYCPVLMDTNQLKQIQQLEDVIERGTQQSREHGDAYKTHTEALERTITNLESLQRQQNEQIQPKDVRIAQLEVRASNPANEAMVSLNRAFDLKSTRPITKVKVRCIHEFEVQLKDDIKEEEAKPGDYIVIKVFNDEDCEIVSNSMG